MWTECVQLRVGWVMVVRLMVIGWVMVVWCGVDGVCWFACGVGDGGVVDGGGVM